MFAADYNIKPDIVTRHSPSLVPCRNFTTGHNGQSALPMRFFAGSIFMAAGVGFHSIFYEH